MSVQPPQVMPKGSDSLDFARGWFAENGIGADAEHLDRTAYHVDLWREAKTIPGPPLPDHGGPGDCAICDARRILRGEL